MLIIKRLITNINHYFLKKEIVRFMENKNTKASNQLRQLMETKKIYDDIVKHLDSKIKDLDETTKQFSLAKSDPISVELKVYKEIRKLFR